MANIISYIYDIYWVNAVFLYFLSVIATAKAVMALIPMLKPGQIVIGAHATFHKGGRIQDLIKAAGCQLKYLPSSSPDRNQD